MKTLRAMAILMAKIASGLALIYFGASNVHVEMHRTDPSTTRVIFFGAIALLGALLLPTIGGWILTTAKGGLVVADPYLPRFGRRASQGEVALESPPADVAPTPRGERDG